MKANGPWQPRNADTTEEALLSAIQTTRLAFEAATPETKPDARDAYKRALKEFMEHV